MRLQRTVLTALLGFALIVPAASPAMAEGTNNSDSGLNLGDGTTVHSEQYLLQEDAKAKCLAAIAKVRKEAYDENIALHGATNVQEYLGGKGISKETYVTPKWSTALEKIAVSRAAETAVHGKVARERLNGKGWGSLNADGYDADIEALAWPAEATCESAVDRWASKKQNYIANKAPYLDYSFLINPDTQAYGIAGVKQTDNTKLKYGSVWAGEAANKPSGREDPYINESGPVDVALNVTNEAAAEAAKKATLAKSVITVAETFTPEFTGTVLDNVKVTYSGTLESADPTIAKVNEDGTVVGLKAGEVKLTLTTEKGEKIVQTLTVKPGEAAGTGAGTGTDTTSNSPAVITITAIAPAELATIIGKPVDLPKTVKVTWSDGKTTEEKVTWKELDTNAFKKAGTIKAEGTLEDGKTISLDIKVSEKPGKPGDKHGKSTSPQTHNGKGGKSELAKTGVELPLLAGAFVLLLGAGISLRKYSLNK